MVCIDLSAEFNKTLRAGLVISASCPLDIDADPGEPSTEDLKLSYLRDAVSIRDLVFELREVPGNNIHPERFSLHKKRRQQPRVLEARR